MPVSDQPRIIRFGVFEVDSLSGELRKNGVRIKLQQQPFQILMLLLSRPRDLITRDELRAKLWPEDTFVDFEHSVNAAIKRLRDALGDSAQAPKFVETVPGRGYRFVFPLEGTQSVREVTTPVRARSWKLAAGVLCVLAILSGAVGYWRESRFSRSPLQERRLTANTTELAITGASISPDGKFLAYSDPTGLNALQVETREIRQFHLPEGFKPIVESWFPDSLHLLASSLERDESRSLWKVSIAGDSPQKLMNDAFGASVSPDGLRIAFLRSPEGQFESPWVRVGASLWQMKSDGTDAAPVVNLPEWEGYVNRSWFGSPAWSPDGTHVATMHFVGSVFIGSAALSTYAIAGGSSRVLLTSDKPFDFTPAVAWSRDGHIFYARSTGEPDDTAVWCVLVDTATAAASGTQERLSAGSGVISALSVTDDCKHIAALRANETTQTFIADFDESTHSLQRPRRLTLDTRPSSPFDWTADSKEVIFVSARRGPWDDIFKQAIDQPTAEVVISDHYNKEIPRLSPDGSSLYYFRRNPARDAYALMRTSFSGGPPVLVLPESTYFGDFRCARTPATLCSFATAPREGTTAVFLMDGRTGTIGRELVRLNGPNAEYGGAISPDGAQVALMRNDGTGDIRFVSVADGTIRDVKLKGWSYFNGGDWTADSKSVMRTSTSPTGDSVLLAIDLNGNVRVMMTAEKHVLILYGIASPNGRHVAVNQAIGENNVWMLDR